MADQRRPGTTVINYDLDLIRAKLDRDEKDHLVVNETLAGKEIKILEIERRVGPLAKDDNNNNVC